MRIFISGIIIATITAFLDQYSKYYIFNMLQEESSRQIEVLPFFNLVMVHNFGVSFGMFNDIPYGHLVLSSLAIAITIILLIWMWRAQKLYLGVALGLIIGGAIGNITDRINYGAVADFLDFHIAGYHWPAFNLADSAVFIGVALILLENFITEKKDENVK
jgi:signal peptidase II